MRGDLERRLETLEANHGGQPDITDPDLELTLAVIEAHYDGKELHLTPDQEQKLRDDAQMMIDEGLLDP